MITPPVPAGRSTQKVEVQRVQQAADSFRLFAAISSSICAISWSERGMMYPRPSSFGDPGEVGGRRDVEVTDEEIWQATLED
ncbi:MAG: hypothetical protein LC797_00085, partial [Chloroflexi bacterium]|nr:hypothetical protein [Chloroflexota bacterium]